MGPGSLSRCYRPEPSSWLSVTGESHENAPYLARHSLFVLPSYVPSFSLPAERLIVLCWRGGLFPPPFFFFFFYVLITASFSSIAWERGESPCQTRAKMAFDGYLLLCYYTAALSGPRGGWAALLLQSSEGTQGLSLITGKHTCAERRLTSGRGLHKPGRAIDFCLTQNTVWWQANYILQKTISKN